MNTVIEFATPAPSCLIPITHPARAVERSTDVARTFEQYRVNDLLDDYELVNSHDWLDTGGFR